MYFSSPTIPQAEKKRNFVNPFYCPSIKFTIFISKHKIHSQASYLIHKSFFLTSTYPSFAWTEHVSGTDAQCLPLCQRALFKLCLEESRKTLQFQGSHPSTPKICKRFSTSLQTASDPLEGKYFLNSWTLLQ